MAIGSAIIIGGTAVQATARDIGQFMAGRFCVGFGVSIISTAAPAYVVEMAHPAWRGAFTGGYNICTSHLKPTDWRLVFGIHCRGVDNIRHITEHSVHTCLENTCCYPSGSISDCLGCNPLPARNAKMVGFRRTKR